MVNVFVPADTDAHPYLTLLYSTLRRYIQITDVKNKKDALHKLKFLIEADIIHLHWIEHYIHGRNIISTVLKLMLFLTSLILLKLLRKRIVITLHNVVPHEKKHAVLGALGFKISLHLTDAIIVHNRWSEKEARRIYGIEKEKIYIIPHGNFIGYYPNEISREEARKILNIPNDAFVILYFGKIKRYKGLNTLISALNGLEDIWILICGEPKDENIKEDLLKFARSFKNCILKLEYIPNEDIQVYMNASDIGILPYEEITTSGTLLLFSSFGKTVIVPNFEPIKEIARDTVIYYDGSTEGLRESILKSRSERLDRLSRRIYKESKKYSWEKIAAMTKQLYQKIVKECVEL
mgnify:CR=1 FL=1